MHKHKLQSIKLSVEMEFKTRQLQKYGLKNGKLKPIYSIWKLIFKNSYMKNVFVLFLSVLLGRIMFKQFMRLDRAVRHRPGFKVQFEQDQFVFLKSVLRRFDQS